MVGLIVGLAVVGLVVGELVVGLNVGFFVVGLTVGNMVGVMVGSVAPIVTALVPYEVTPFVLMALGDGVVLLLLLPLLLLVTELVGDAVPV